MLLTLFAPLQRQRPQSNLRTLAAIVGMLGFGLSARAQFSWPLYGGNAQHTAQSPITAHSLQRILWSSPVDRQPQYHGDDLLIHYGSPLITPNNTVIFPVKTGVTEGFQIEARSGADGTRLWTQTTNYLLPPHRWTPPVGCALTPANRLYFPAAGGILYYRLYPDVATPFDPGMRLLSFRKRPPVYLPRVFPVVFYGLDNYMADPASYKANVYINTPLTSDKNGNLFFGFQVTGDTPLHLKSGIVRITPTGQSSWVSVPVAANNAGIVRVVQNCAPALSNDGKTLYVAVTSADNLSFGVGYLLALDSATLKTIRSVRLKDAQNPSQDATLSDDGTSSPTVGPDGDVYFGVLEHSFGDNHGRGWLLHFSGDLKTTKTPGAFGWDDTASVVPASAVPSYHGTSSYLLLTKYNNYVEAGGDGVNKVALLDPNTAMTDPVTQTQVMQEVLTIAGPTPDLDFRPDYPNAVREWCINTAVIDPVGKCALVNNEDGILYRWDFTTNTLTEQITLTPGIGEAYTPTLIGPDGTVYAINNATLFAVGE